MLHQVPALALGDALADGTERGGLVMFQASVWVWPFTV